jgi:hypothetical protein
MGKMRGAYILVGKPDGKRPLRRPWYRWEDNIKVGLCDIEWEGVDCWFRIGTHHKLL